MQRNLQPGRWPYAWREDVAAGADISLHNAYGSEVAEHVNKQIAHAITRCCGKTKTNLASFTGSSLLQGGPCVG